MKDPALRTSSLYYCQQKILNYLLDSLRIKIKP